MFCMKCGNAVGDAVAVCPQCNTPSAGVAAPASLKPSVPDRLKTTSKQALEAFKTFATDPVGGLSVAYERLGDSRSFGVGLTFAVVFIICCFVGGYMMLPSFMRDGIFHELGLEGFLKAVLVAAVPFASILAVGAAVRAIFHGQGKVGADSFLAGACLLPLAALVLLAGILGLGNGEVVAIAGVFALCASLFMVFAGYTRIYKISERLATVCVPAMILISGWLMKIVYVTMLKQYGFF